MTKTKPTSTVARLKARIAKWEGRIARGEALQQKRKAKLAALKQRLKALALVTLSLSVQASQPPLSPAEAVAVLLRSGSDRNFTGRGAGRAAGVAARGSSSRDARSAPSGPACRRSPTYRGPSVRPCRGGTSRRRRRTRRSARCGSFAELQKGRKEHDRRHLRTKEHRSARRG